MARLAADAKAFTYRTRESEIVRLEKAQGITRRTVVPAAIDALLLQGLTDAISASVLRAQPTETAYYSRSHQPRTLEHLDESFPSDWLSLWKEGQRRIWEFTQSYDVVVVTDVANYFDAIPLAQLRNRISGLGHFSEVVLDLLFQVLENLTWRPEYLPRSGTGLPQIQFDAPRLLAHAYLYEADRYLRRACRGDVVRWMDDITFGAESRTDAKRILRELDELLSKLGVRLNAGKTKILSAEAGMQHFKMMENRNLTIIQNLLDLRTNSGATRRRALHYLKAFWNKPWRRTRTGYWDKIAKRCFTLFGRLESPYLQRWVPEILSSCPSLRTSVFRYYGRLGYSRARFGHIREFISGPHCLDDAGLFSAVRLLVDWKMPAGGVSVTEARGLVSGLPRSAVSPSVGLAAGVWLLSKYAEAHDELRTFILNNVRAWRASEWAGRQVAAVTPRLDPPTRQRVSNVLGQHGLLEGMAVLAHLEEIRRATALNQMMRSYLSHPSEPYPISKVMVTLEIMRGSLPDNEKVAIRSRALTLTDDPTYTRLLRAS